MKNLISHLILLVVLAAATQTYAQDDKSMYNDLQQVAADMPDDLPRFAILIGNANYNEITSLDSPELDVEGMYNVLLNLNFPDQNMLLLKNLTKREMDIEVGRFVKKLSQKCLVVFYYSGHGAQFAIDNTKGASNYLLPVDLPADIADVEIPSYSYDLDNALGLIMRQNPDGPKVFILDACRSNPLSFAKKDNAGKGLADIGRFDNAIIGYAAEPGKVACDGGTGHLSPYTETLIEVMQRPGLKLEEVFADVRKEMIKKEKCYTASHASILLNHDYYFISSRPANQLIATIPDYPPTDTKPNTPQKLLLPEMVFIEGGSFRMGKESYDKVHTVKLSDFSIGKYEVTNEQFCFFLNEKGNQTEKGALWLNTNGESCFIENADGVFRPKPGYSAFPVSCVTWYGAKSYCDWLSEKALGSYRLPTEAEWEYTAINSEKYGVYNMIDDNEWCYDFYNRDYYKNSPKIDPMGPYSGTYGKVIRRDLRFRHGEDETYAGNGDNFPGTDNYIINFRVVKISDKADGK